MIGSREALHHSSTGGQRIEQAAKVTGTINTFTTGPRDLIASGRVSTHMRKRSFHSSSIVGAKGNSVDILDNKVTSVGITNDERKTKIVKSVRPSLADIVTSKLNSLLTRDMKYNNIVTQIISDPLYLIACYDEIRGKAGNMTRGVGKITLDGINYEWFEKAAKELKAGTYQFSPSRRVEIPKANSDKMRPLTIASPRDKIVQKALQVVVEVI